MSAEPASAFPPALPLAGEGAPALLVAALAVLGAALAVVAASIGLAPPVTPPEPVTIVVHEKAPPPEPVTIVVHEKEPAPPPIVIHEPAPPPTVIRVEAPAPPPPCFDPVILMFAPGSAAPLPAADASIGIVRLRDWLDHHAEGRLLVEGHADSRGDDAHNLALSFARAKSVASILARNGVPAGRIAVRAAGAADAKREWITSVNQKRAAVDGDARDRRAVVGVEGLAACKSAAGATEHP
jgi:outer membrane protein OmpA-like peptidoglycan-associated protein